MQPLSRQSVTAVIKAYFTTMPVLFPLIGLFHVWLFFSQGYLFFDSNVSMMYWFRPVVVAAYAVFWIGACFRRKRYATAYLVLTIFTVSFFYLYPKVNHLDGQNIFQMILNQAALLHRAIGDILLDPLPINIFFSFIILLYYRRMLPQGKQVAAIETAKEQD